MSDPGMVPRNEHRSCGTKRQHDRGSASQTLRKMHERGERNLVAYPCKHCGFWHIGHHDESLFVGEHTSQSSKATK